MAIQPDRRVRSVPIGSCGSAPHTLARKRTGCRRTWALEQLSKLADELPEQDVLHASLGRLLLEDGQLEKALAALTKALASPLCVGWQRGNVLYNLACFYSLFGDEQQCREKLRESHQVKRLDVNWLEKDTDLDSVRGRSWFRELVDSIRTPPPTAP